MKLLFIAGIAFFIGAIVLIAANYEKYEVERYGTVVNMRIVKMPSNCLGSRVRYFVEYNYKGVNYDKATRGNFCQRHRIGDSIEMKLLPGSKYILYSDESALTELVSGGVLALIGLIISITQWKKMRP